MRFLHTADWHLGRPFHGESLLRAQEKILDFIVDAAREARVDAVLIAGDVFDRALPPVPAVKLADEALRRLSEIAPLIAISGNHDSAARLGFASALLDRVGVHLRTVAGACGEPVLLGDVCVYAIPYLEPDVVRPELGCEERSHRAVLAAAMELVRRDRARRPKESPAIVMAHAFLAGVSPTGSERDLAVGGAAAVPASLFSGIDYVALGHIHRPQAAGANGRYAGSPLAFSFSEAGDRKSVTVVELEAGRSVRTEVLAAPVPRRLVCLRGTLDELLADPTHADHEASWVQATLTDPARAQDAMERLRRRFPHTAELRFEPTGVTPQSGGSYAERLRGLDDTELLAQFVRDVRGHAPSEEESALLEDALVSHRVREAAG